MIILFSNFFSDTYNNLNCFSITSIDAYSNGPWKLPHPVKILGVGNPINDNCEPSVPPRIGSVLGSISSLANTRLGISIMCCKGLIFLPYYNIGHEHRLLQGNPHSEY